MLRPISVESSILLFPRVSHHLECFKMVNETPPPMDSFILLFHKMVIAFNYILFHWLVI
uniref:Uncharacterized protein n=1 Tax=Arundo donax TaxID=35708 RepID=A0A0A9C782_ARUDO